MREDTITSCMSSWVEPAISHPIHPTIMTIMWNADKRVWSWFAISHDQLNYVSGHGLPSHTNTNHTSSLRSCPGNALWSSHPGMLSLSFACSLPIKFVKFISPHKMSQKFCTVCAQYLITLQFSPVSWMTASSIILLYFSVCVSGTLCILPRKHNMPVIRCSSAYSPCFTCVQQYSFYVSAWALFSDSKWVF